MFDIEAAKKKDASAYSIMADAIRRHYGNDDQKINPALCRVMAQIIDDGFLDGVIEHEVELTKYETDRRYQLRQQIQSLEERYNRLHCEVSQAENRLEVLEERAKDYQRILDDDKGDPVLAGAKMAFLWIFDRTQDEQKASKAFNSYLLGKGKEADQ